MDEAHAYVATHFWPIDRIARGVGAPIDEVEALIAARCAPGPIYAYDSVRGWWSALGGWKDSAGGDLAAEAARWYSPWIVWSLRKACVERRAGASPGDSAARRAREFAHDFERALRDFPLARLGFPRCFGDDGALLPESVRVAAADEWEAWLKGGYGVCLRAFTGETCVRKESLGAMLKRRVVENGDLLGAAGELLDACAALQQLLLPFAPWERPSGTPGRTIDVIVPTLGLGIEQPYG